MFKPNKNSILIGIAVIGIVITGILILINENPNQILNLKGFGGLSTDAVAKKAIDYLNSNGLTRLPASLISASEESGLVKIKMKIGQNEFDLYATKDGKLLFPEAFKIDEKIAKQSADNSGQQQQPKACEDLKKTDKPVLDAFIVSQCPFGLQMQRILADIVKNIPSLASNIKVRYIGSISGDTISSMHGEKEAQENLRQICIREENASKYWDYVSCYIKKGDTEGCLTSTGVNKNKISGCMSDKNRGLAYAKEDFDLNAKYKIQGSPTLVLNGEQVAEGDFGGRTSQAVKTLLCCGFNAKPDACSKKLNDTQAATSFSESYSSGSGSNSNSAGGCGQ
jgi:hypothetical protein